MFATWQMQVRLSTEDHYGAASPPTLVVPSEMWYNFLISIIILVHSGGILIFSRYLLIRLHISYVFVSILVKFVKFTG